MIDLITIYFMFFVSLLVFSIIPYIIGKTQETISNRIETSSKNRDKNQDSFLDKILSDKDFKNNLEKELNILRVKKGLQITNPEEIKADLKEVKENKKYERYDSFFNSTALNTANKIFIEMDTELYYKKIDLLDGILEVCGSEVYNSLFDKSLEEIQWFLSTNNINLKTISKIEIVEDDRFNCYCEVNNTSNNIVINRNNYQSKKRERGRIFDSPAIKVANEYSRARQRKLKIIGEVIQDEK